MMGWDFKAVLAAGGGLLLVTGAAPTFGQSTLNQSSFVQQLTPVPDALRRGHQGLPTIGSAPPSQGRRAEPTAYRPDAAPEPRYAPAPASRRTASRPAPRGEPKKTASAAALPGCPTASGETADKPMVGFKVAFEFGSAQIKPESHEVLRELGKALNNGLSEQKLFEIEGHTDAVGTYAYNEQLSAARAEAVKEFLIKETNVAPERLKVAGRAYCEPANPGNPYGAENRRVVVVNLSG